MTSPTPLAPEAFDDARRRLWNELVGVHDSWYQYEVLGESPERAAMLSACAGWFFGLVQRLLLREVLLGLSRLTDNAATGRNTNLVLHTLLQDPALIAHPETARRISDAIATATSAVAPMRVHRHKYIAHLDHAVALGQPGSLPSGVSRETISAAVNLVEEPYRIHSRTIRESEPSFEVSTTGGAPALIRILETSDRWQRFKQIQERRPT